MQCSKGKFTFFRSFAYRQQHCQNNPHAHASAKTIKMLYYACQASSWRCHFVKKLAHAYRLNTYACTLHYQPDLTVIHTYFMRWLIHTNVYDLIRTNLYDL